MSGGVMFQSEPDPDQICTPISGHERHIQTCIEAIRSGVNYIDTAPLYGGGRAEIVLGMVHSLPSFWLHYVTSTILVINF